MSGTFHVRLEVTVDEMGSFEEAAENGYHALRDLSEPIVQVVAEDGEERSFELVEDEWRRY